MLRIHAAPAALVLFVACTSPPAAPTLLEPAFLPPEVVVGDEVLGVREAWVHSVDNDNRRFRISLRTDPTEPRLPAHLRWADGTEIPLTDSGGAHQQVWFGMEAGAQQAATIAAALGTGLERRVHRGHQLTPHFRPRASYAPGTAVPVGFEVENTGAISAAFHPGGRHGVRGNERFSFRVERGGRPLPDPTPTFSFGGLSMEVALEPGDVHTEEVDLAAWFAFDEPGTYSVHGIYEIEVVAPRDAPLYRRGPMWNALPWDEVLTATFTVQVDE